jgi:hypothetical protein
VRRKVAMADEGRGGALGRVMVALISLTLWCAVGAGGRWIGFS